MNYRNSNGKPNKSSFYKAMQKISIAGLKAFTAKVGDLGKKLHTGRSRNDQVATDSSHGKEEYPSLAKQLS